MPIDDWSEIDEEAQLILLARKGDPSAFARLMQRHERQVLATAARILWNLEEAKDADLILASEEKQVEPPIPARLEPSLKQPNFSYKTYQLLDTVMLGGLLGGEASSNGSAIYPGTDKEARTYVSYKSAVRGQSIYLDELRIGLEVPVVREEPGGKNSQTSYRQVGFNTNVEMSEGQQMVVGKAGLGSGWALIAVISVKIE